MLEPSMNDCSGDGSPWLPWSKEWPAGMVVTVTEKDITPPLTSASDEAAEEPLPAALWFMA